MIDQIKKELWQQFGASIDMLKNAIEMCPTKQWDTKNNFWHKAYHCIFYLDYYLTKQPSSFQPPKPFSLSELDPSGLMPEKTYTKTEVLNYLQYCRDKCNRIILSLDVNTAFEIWSDKYKSFSFFELQLYNMRHVQHHAAQLNTILRKENNEAPKWVSVAE